MAFKRFIRDGVLAGLIDEVKDILDTVPEDDPDNEFQFHYINSLYITFKTGKTALEGIEESIEIAREHDPTGEICAPLCDAAMHLQTGILSLYESLQVNISPEDDDISLDDLS